MSQEEHVEGKGLKAGLKARAVSVDQNALRPPSKAFALSFLLNFGRYTPYSIRQSSSSSRLVSQWATLPL